MVVAAVLVLVVAVAVPGAHQVGQHAARVRGSPAATPSGSKPAAGGRLEKPCQRAGKGGKGGVYLLVGWFGEHPEAVPTSGSGGRGRACPAPAAAGRCPRRKAQHRAQPGLGHAGSGQGATPGTPSGSARPPPPPDSPRLAHAHVRTGGAAAWRMRRRPCAAAAQAAMASCRPSASHPLPTHFSRRLHGARRPTRAGLGP
jgi:hypothetical protein